MKLITCSYCGTEYDKKQLRCPNCGTSDVKSAEVDRAPRKKQRDPDKIPGWLWACICGVLALAVLIGLVAFVISMGYFEEGFDLNAIPTNRTQEELPQEQEIYPYEKPEEKEPEEDLESGVCRELQLSQDEIILDEEGARFFLSAATVPVYTTDEIVFESADDTIATVGENGMITAVAPGETEIVVTCGDVSEVCKVVCDFELEIVEEEEPTDSEGTEENETTEQEEETVLPPSVSPDDFTLFYPGEEAQLSVKNVPDGASVSYVSSNAAVVTVTNNGKVTAVGNGQATITVTVGDIALTVIARCNLNSTTEGGDTTETQAYTGPFALNYTDVTFQYQGEKLTLKLRDANGKEVTGLSWVSGNGGICSVSNGTATAMGSGETKVSTTYNGTTYSCIIRTAF